MRHPDAGLFIGFRGEGTSMRKAVVWLTCLLIGMAVAWPISRMIKYALEPEEIRNYQPGKPLFTHPVPEAYAQMVGERLRRKLRDESIMQRFDDSYSLPVRLGTRVIAFLIDPINLLMTIGFAAIAFVVYRASNRRNQTSQAAPPTTPA
jgi:hypothetical protein